MKRLLPLLALVAVIRPAAAGAQSPLCDGEPDPVLNFEGIDPATSAADARSGLDARRERILSHFARTPLDYVWRCVDAGGALSNPDCAALALDLGSGDADPVLAVSDSGELILGLRTGVERLCNVLLARIALGCSIDPRLEAAFANPDNAAWAPPGSDVDSTDLYARPDVGPDGNADYDFQMMTFIRLIYVALRDHPGSLEQPTLSTFIERMLTQQGENRVFAYELLLLGGIIGTAEVEDTENHILMTEAARYLTNQLVMEFDLPCEEDNCDNSRNGNNEWMVEHLQQFMEGMFYEYNSRPYQGYALQPFDLLAGYADDEGVRTAAQMVLDTVTAWTALQSNHLRRAPAFRRQPPFLDIYPDAPGGEVSSRGRFLVSDGEYSRLVVLTGDYAALPSYEDTASGQTFAYVQSGANGWGRSSANFGLFAAVSHYAIPDSVLELVFPADGSPQHFVGYHDVVEIYARTAAATISAGGQQSDPELPDIRFEPRVPGTEEENQMIVDTLAGAVASELEGERGYARPTFIFPSAELSGRHADMMRFEGQARPADPLEQDPDFESTCVAPGFACGLQPDLGEIIAPLADACAAPECLRDGDWLFMDFTSGGGGWPRYGFYAALYERPCLGTACEGTADSYGLIEIAEPSDATSFSAFQSDVQAQNAALDLTPDGLHDYRTVAGHDIEFTVRPSPGEASVTAVDDVRYSRNYADWAMARSATVQSTTPGRFTIDDPATGARLLLDLTTGSDGQIVPRRIETRIPALRTDPPVQATDESEVSGRYFDQSSSLTPTSVLTEIAISAGSGCVRGLSVTWNNELRSSHGDTTDAQVLALRRRDHVQTVRIARAMDSSEVRYVELTTNNGRSLTAGSLDGAAPPETFEAGEFEELGGFHGRAGACLSHLGVTWFDPEPLPSGGGCAVASSPATPAGRRLGLVGLLLLCVTGIRRRRR